MTELDLPDNRPMPDDVRERLRARLVEEEPIVEGIGTPRAEPPPGRLARARLPLAVAAAVCVLMLGVGIALRPDAPAPLGAASGGGAAAALDPQVEAWTRTCAGSLPDPASWSPGAQIDAGTTGHYLVIRNEETAKACVIDGDRASALGGDDRHTYDRLTANRPFDWFNAWNVLGGPSVQFGITTADVTALSVTGPDGVTRPADLRNETFAVETPVGEASNVSSTHRVQATLKNGEIITGSLRN